MIKRKNKVLLKHFENPASSIVSEVWINRYSISEFKLKQMIMLNRHFPKASPFLCKLPPIL